MSRALKFLREERAIYIYLLNPRRFTPAGARFNTPTRLFSFFSLRIFIASVIERRLISSRRIEWKICGLNVFEKKLSRGNFACAYAGERKRSWWGGGGFGERRVVLIIINKRTASACITQNYTSISVRKIYLFSHCSGGEKNFSAFEKAYMRDAAKGLYSHLTNPIINN